MFAFGDLGGVKCAFGIDREKCAFHHESAGSHMSGNTCHGTCRLVGMSPVSVPAC